MLSLIVGQWPGSISWSAIVGWALAGGLFGVLSARLAQAYTCLIARGHDPTPDTFRQAGGMACGLLKAHELKQGAGLSALHIMSALCMAGVASALLLRYGVSVYFVALVCAAAVLLALALIDAATGLLPDALTLPLLWGGLAMAWLGVGPVLHDAVAGAILGYLFPWVLFFVYKCACRQDGMGHGDFKLLAGLGAWLGWQAIAPLLLAASVAAVVAAMWRQKTWRPAGAYAFGPFLIVSAMGVFVSGSALHSWFS